ncbi:MAG: hypothetical protein FVQ81_18150 [Candidatus Glassbacteria bacterium]|nr:hypothetical protein [Candidatus Glassbacteria bacterium]
MASRTFAPQQSQGKSSDPLPGFSTPPDQGGMSWEEACRRSSTGTAARTGENGRAMLRSRHGNGVVETASGTIRLAFPNELEGYQDWEPVRG